MKEDYRDFLRELVRAEARFLVVGAHALSVHGVPRATVDLDVWTEPSTENARRVWQALAGFGAPLDTLGIAMTDLTRPNVVIQLGLPPWRIDVLTSVSGVEFEDAWVDRLSGTFEDVPVTYLGRAAFVRNKRASGRKRDLADLEMLGED